MNRLETDLDPLLQQLGDLLVSVITFDYGESLSSPGESVISLVGEALVNSAKLVFFALLLTLPITVLTLGLFYIVVNGLAFALAAWLVPGFDVSSFGWAMLGALLVGLVSWFIGSFRQLD